MGGLERNVKLAFRVGKIENELCDGAIKRLIESLEEIECTWNALDNQVIPFPFVPSEMISLNYLPDNIPL